MPNLLPDGFTTEVVELSELTPKKPIGYKNGVKFDYKKAGDFVRDGRNRLMDSDGVESWQSWVINCMETQRYKHLAYSTDFGIELDKVFAAASRAEAENILTRQITEAIMADPYGRTDYVAGLTYTWTDPDAVRVDATLHGINDVTIDVTAYLTKGGI